MQLLLRQQLLSCGGRKKEADYIKRKFGQGHSSFNPSFGNNINLESGWDPWEMLAGAGTCLDQCHCVLGRVSGLVAIYFEATGF
jgi:hypothetical protein